MARNSNKFDPDQPYGTVRRMHNGQGIKYQQNGALYSHAGDFVCAAPGCEPVKAASPAVPEAAKPTKAELKKQALKEAADRLGDFTVPSDLQDVAKENAEALAAEDNA